MLKLLSRSVSCGSLASVAAALVLAGICPDALAAGDAGSIHLEIGASNRFVYYDAEGDITPYQQGFHTQGKGSCLMEWDTNPLSPELVKLTPGGGAGAAMPGFGATSIGVYDGPKGTPCTRASKYLNESLTFELGITTTSELVANAFDRLELDIEVKADAWVYLTTYIGNSPARTYQLRTGASINPSDGLASKPDGQPQEASPLHPIVNCSARSDSGPDSGSSDNCRWIINDWGTKFVIGFSPLGGAGEFSLEGGADWPDPSVNHSVISLTYVQEGNLLCDDASVELVNSSQTSCSVVQTQGSACSSVHYFFREIGGEAKGCEFYKDSYSQLAASMTITFPPEPRPLVAPLQNVPLTTVLFPNPDGTVTSYQPGLCTGTVGGTAGNPTIVEVLTATPPPEFVDVVSSTAEKDWACILEQGVEYQGPLVDPKMQVSQTILFWGDPAMIRQ